MTRNEHDMTTTDQSRMISQNEIWRRLYGPVRAEQMMDDVRRRRDADPDLDLVATFRAVEPDEDSDDYDVIGRPGFG
jgi:hypothetical protein